MDERQPSELTLLLQAWSGGDESAFEKLTPLVYAELHRIASRHMANERNGHVLQTSALVNEAYLQLARGGGIEWKDRNHFFAVSALLMRRVLVDFARSHRRAKRGGGVPHVDLSTLWEDPSANPVGLPELDQALTRLAALDERQAKMVELRFFGGFSVREIAEALNVAEITVHRDWRQARAWLYNELVKQPAP